MCAPPAERPLVLVVDDTPANLAVLLDILGASGFDVSLAEDGETALEQAGYVQPELILLDVAMPGLDGFETCQLLKQRADTRDIPVLFMSALHDTEAKVRGLQLGAVDYITKPFHNAEVLARVRAQIALRRLQRSLQQSEQRLQSIVDSAMDAIVVFDADARVLLFNRAAERVFRCAAAEVLGRAVDDLLSGPLGKVVESYVRASRDATQPPAPTFIAEGHQAKRVDDGEPFAIEASLSCAAAPAQRLYTLILRDIDERLRSQAELRQLQGLNRYLEDELRSAKAGDEVVVAASPGLRAVLQQVQQVAPTDATVLVGGETGTGKEVIADAIHRASRRRHKPLVKLNCAALPPHLIESELYGHERGAFTGAVSRRAGRFELADGGTLFLDEVGELPLDLQAKLLRVLQQGEFERLGGSTTLKVDVRIVAATNRDLAREVAAGNFRADLYYRLNVFPIALPPLRERPADIAALARHFLQHFASRYGKRIEPPSAAQLEQLQRYRWPGNVRELQHVIERAVILTQGLRLALGDWFGGDAPVAAAPVDAHGSLRDDALTLADANRAHILKVLDEAGWRVSGRAGAAERLGVKPTTLESRMKKLGIRRPASRPGHEEPACRDFATRSRQDVSASARESRSGPRCGANHGAAQSLASSGCSRRDAGTALATATPALLRGTAACGAATHPSNPIGA